MADERAIAAVLARFGSGVALRAAFDALAAHDDTCISTVTGLWACGCGYELGRDDETFEYRHRGHLAASILAAIAAVPGNDAARALWKAERAIYLLRMNTHRGEDYRDAIEDADKVIRELIIAADLSAAHAAAEPEAGR